MINVIWLAMILIGVGVAAIRCLGITVTPLGIYLAPTFEPLSQLTNGIFEYAKFAVELAIGLVGIMALWLGIMKIAEKSGLIKVIARGLRPVMVRLFPDIPPEHPAMGSTIMALSATMLGLGNASTPLGLKAFQDMQTLNKHKNIATNAQCTFMALSTSSVTIIPATIIGIRSAAGSSNPTEIIAPVIVATVVSTTVALIMTKILQRLPRFQVENYIEENEEEESHEES
ncbi:MAG: nucleoside recognition domain-containing protein [Candidatus Neomarinimicrobiota bacterium]|jgi:spore maturation protein A|nr:nucleoside recognition domain-containing protein [Candidatus Neomarinimicrobiota bacterium]MDX9779747.1 nucleoside recognition domain-containing protein [bacterium]